jgi:hypothetical protein
VWFGLSAFLLPPIPLLSPYSHYYEDINMKINKEFDLREYFPEDDVIPVNLSVETAGKLIGISRPSVYPLMTSGELESIHIKGRRLIPTRCVVAYLARISCPSQKKVNHEACDGRLAETTSADSFYTQSGSSPPDVTSGEGGAV